MIAELNIRTCRECGNIFRTPHQDQLCPTCKKKHRQMAMEAQAASHRKPPMKEEPQKPKVSLAQEQKVERIYNAIHKDRYYGYGDITKIIENTKADRCVCCGDIIPEGRLVCPICESEGERNV